MPEESRFNWLVLQDGQLPLRPTRQIDFRAEHRCTSVLIWPDDTLPTRSNSIIVDPCFTAAGFANAQAELGAISASFADVGCMFISHPHGDHMFSAPPGAPIARWRMFHADHDTHFEALSVEYCPGHHPLLRALAFTGPDGRRVWVVGDAILDEVWLREWGYYWPNGYAAVDVIETWRSVAKILASADVVVPGHGPALDVTAPLLDALIDAFPRAPFAVECPDVAEKLRRRRDQIAS